MRYFILSLGLVSSFSFGLAIGDKAPAIDLKGSDGKSHSLKQALSTHKAAVVAFIATKCPVSNDYNGRFKALSGELAGKNVAFLAVNSNDTEDMNAVVEHASKEKFGFSVLKDEKHAVADLYQAEKTPEVFLVGKDSKVLYHGRIDDSREEKAVKRRDLVSAVDEYIGGKPISVSSADAFGCSIKRKN